MRRGPLKKDRTMTRKTRKAKSARGTSPQKMARVFDRAARAGKTARARILDESGIGARTRRAIQQALPLNADNEPRVDTMHGLRTAVADAAGLAVAAPQQLAPGQVLGSNYRIERLIGEGAFAGVYLATDTALRRLVAVKVSDVFTGEARTLAALEHPGIVRVFQEVREKHTGYSVLAMQYVAGSSLAGVVSGLKARRKAGESWTGETVLMLTAASGGEVSAGDPASFRARETVRLLDGPEFALWVAARLAEALAYAHSRGVLHLDIKPANVLVSALGQPYLTDFNVSIRRDAGAGLTTRFLGGTPPYMAPEAMKAFAAEPADRLVLTQKIDGRADIYGLGVLLRELLELCDEQEDIEHFATLTDYYHYRAKVRWVLDRLIAEDPDARFATASAAAQAIAACLEYRLLLRRLPTPGLWMTWGQRFPTTAITIFGLLPQAAGILAALGYNGTHLYMHLTPAQQSLFTTLNSTVLPLSLFLAVAYWTWALRRALPRTVRDAITRGERRAAVHLPVAGLLTAALGWIPGGIIYPWAFYVSEHGFSLENAVHVAASFFVGFAVSASYTLLAHQYFLLRVLYPRVLIPSDTPLAHAKIDLANAARWSRLSYFAVSVPLLAAVAFVPVAMQRFADEGDVSARAVLVSLILLGYLGGSLSSRIRPAIERLVVLFAGRVTVDTRRKGRLGLAVARRRDSGGFEPESSAKTLLSQDAFPR